MRSWSMSYKIQYWNGNTNSFQRHTHTLSHVHTHSLSTKENSICTVLHSVLVHTWIHFINKGIQLSGTVGSLIMTMTKVSREHVHLKVL